ncbi:MAG: 50S ribosomal protein L18 [Tatlockia sp.]|jgi:large subunit ribosomal protein L18
MNKYKARTRRGLKAKAVLRHSDRPRLVVHRSNANIQGQIVVRGTNGDTVLVCCSTLDKDLKAKLKGTKVEQATQVGELLAERAKAGNITKVSFDRAGHKYHGRVKALADGAREAGLIF